MSSKLKSLQKSFCSNFDHNNSIRSQCCWAVMAYATLLPDLVIIFHLILICISKKFETGAPKPLVNGSHDILAWSASKLLGKIRSCLDVARIIGSHYKLSACFHYNYYEYIYYMYFSVAYQLSAPTAILLCKISHFSNKISILTYCNQGMNSFENWRELQVVANGAKHCHRASYIEKNRSSIGQLCYHWWHQNL